MKKINRFTVVMLFGVLVGPEVILAAPLYDTFKGATQHFNNINGQQSDVYKALTRPGPVDPIPRVVSADSRVTEAVSSGDSSGLSALLSYSCQSFTAYREVQGVTDAILTGGASNGSASIDLTHMVSQENIGSNEDFSNWLTGISPTTARVHMALIDDANNHAKYFNDLILTSVSAHSTPAPVPESTTFLLVSLGLIGMGLAQCKDCFS
ncbi:MAG: hypothetical protein P8101_06570 [Candidatus Thiodiazotropha sp.]